MMELNHVTQSFKKKIVLKDIHFMVENKVYGLLGTNGSGKTTLLRIMVNLLKPTSGQINKNKEFMIGYLPQKFGLFKDLTVSKHMEYFCCLKGIQEDKWQEEIIRTLSLVHMEEYIKQKCKSLSGGMVRRVGIAQAMLGQPHLIVFDEPTTGLDPEERLRFKSIISSLAKTQPIIISTHIVEDIDSLCNELLILKNCHLYQFQNIHEFIQNSEGKIFIVDNMDTNTDILIKEFTDNNHVKYRVISHNRNISVKPTLEDAYIQFLRSEQK